MVVCWTGWSEYLAKLLFYWDFNGAKKRKYAASGRCVEENALLVSGLRSQHGQMGNSNSNNCWSQSTPTTPATCVCVYRLTDLFVRYLRNWTANFFNDFLKAVLDEICCSGSPLY